MLEIIGIKEYPQHLDAAADYFSAAWAIDRQFYVDAMLESLSTKNPYPRWYVMMDDGKIIGSYGIVEHDFMADRDFYPWLCSVYVNPEKRGQQLGKQLVEHCVKEAAKLGLKRLYLHTDHVGYYEKYGWHYAGDFPKENGKITRVYFIDAE